MSTEMLKGLEMARAIVATELAEWQNRLGKGGVFWDGYSSFAKEALKRIEQSADDAVRVYKAMLAAAPSAELKPAGVAPSAEEVIERCAIRGRIAQLEGKLVDEEIRSLKSKEGGAG